MERGHALQALHPPLALHAPLDQSPARNQSGLKWKHQHPRWEAGAGLLAYATSLASTQTWHPHLLELPSSSNVHHSACPKQPLCSPSALLPG